MSLPDGKLISVINIYRITDDGRIISRRYETDFHTHLLLSKRPISSDGLNFDITPDLRLTCTNFADEGAVKIIEIEGPPLHQNLNIPYMIRCQNCETNYPTKYQYQRHQCEFNADKVVLKPNADLTNLDKGQRIKYDCPICGKQFVSRNNLERHQASHQNSQENTCEHCNKQFVSENRLRIHKENHCKKAGDISKFYRSDVTVWKCRKCQEVFSSSTTAAFHTEACNEVMEVVDIVYNLKSEPTAPNGAPVDNKIIEKISTEILLQCEFCNRTYADKTVLLTHQRTHKTDKNYECAICKESFTSYVIASQHWLRKCSEKANLFYLPKLTYCEFCDRTFKSHEILYTHKIKKKHYTQKTHTNDISSHPVSDGQQLDRRIVKNEGAIDKIIEDVLLALEIPINKHNLNESGETHDKEDDNVAIKIEPQNQNGTSGDQPEKKKRGRKRKLSKNKTKKPCGVLEDGCKYQCERCPMVWETVTDLEAHREKEHAANYSCDECGQVLHSARALLIHSRAHKSLKPYVCETCGRSYSQTSHLWQHMRFHQGIKPFACPHEGCEARYTIRPDLKDHIRKVHTRERPFKCSVCGKCFLTGSVYYQHRLIHTEDRRYGCDMCDKRFFRADALNNHKRIHTNERPYPCFVCGRMFRQKGDRNKHFRTQHPDAILN